MMLTLSVVVVLFLGAAICWYLAGRPSRAAQPDSVGLTQDIHPAVTAVTPESTDLDLKDERDQEEVFREETSRQTGKLSLLGDLAAGIAHEINNPIAIMVEEAGWIEDLLEEAEFPQSKNLEEFKRDLKQIKTQGGRCKAIIHNLLSFGRKTSIKLEEVRINDLVSEVVKAYTKKERSGNLSTETHFTEPLPECQLSPSEM